MPIATGPILTLDISVGVHSVTQSSPRRTIQRILCIQANARTAVLNSSYKGAKNAAIDEEYIVESFNLKRLLPVNSG